MIFLSFLFEKKCFRFVTDIIGKENKKGMNVSLYLEESDAKMILRFSQKHSLINLQGKETHIMKVRKEAYIMVAKKKRIGGAIILACAFMIISWMFLAVGTKDVYAFDEGGTEVPRTPVPEDAITLVEGRDFVYSLTGTGEGNAIIFEKYTGSATKVIIPDEIDVVGENGNSTTYPITVIRKNAFKNSNVEFVQLPSKLLSIQSYAFDGCGDLSGIDLPETLRTIGDYAFRNCTSLTYLYMPKSLVECATNALDDCSGIETLYVGTPITKRISLSDMISLETLVLLEGVTEVSERSYEGLPIKKLIIPDTLTSIGRSAFSGTDLTEVTIPTSVKTVGDIAFEGAPLEKVVCGAESIGESAFSPDYYNQFNPTLESITLLEGVKEIGNSAFYNTCITELELPDTLETLGEYAFGRSDLLTKVVFGSGLRTISDHAFDGDEALRSISLQEGLEVIGESAFSGCDITNLQIPDGVTTIGAKAFYYNSHLSKIEFPDTVESIGDFAFRGAEPMLRVSLPDSVKELGQGVFADCKALSYIDLPNQIEYIPQLLLASTKVKSIEIPDSVTEIRNWAFSFNHGDNAPQLYVAPPLESITFGEGSQLKSIGEYAFYGTKLQEIHFPGTLTSIGKGAFGGTEVRELTFPEGISEIGASAFAYCTKLETVHSWPSALQKIGTYVFSSCEALSDVPEISWETIPESTFSDCTSLTNVQLAEGIESIEQYAFFNCFLSEIHIPDSVTYIGDQAFAFRTNSELTHDVDVNLGNGVTVVGNKCFLNCPIEYIVIPEQLTSIGERAFGYGFYTFAGGGWGEVSYSENKNERFVVYGVTQDARDYAETNGFTYIEGTEPIDPGPTDPDPGPTDPDPGPTDPDPGPTDPDPGPTDPDPGPTDPDPGPTDPSPKPTDPSPKPTDLGVTPVPSKEETKKQELRAGQKIMDNKKNQYQVDRSGMLTLNAVNKRAKEIKIPAAVKKNGVTYRVTNIKKNAFKNSKKLKKVTIGKNVNKIGANAFRGCSNLKTITIMSTKLNAKSFGKNALKGINKKAIIRVPRRKYKAYKKILRKAGISKTVKIKKI